MWADLKTLRGLSLTMLDWAKIIHAIEIVLENFKTKQGPGQKLASIVGLAHYKPGYSWAGKQLS